jgi:hypothetical protein
MAGSRCPPDTVPDWRLSSIEEAMAEARRPRITFRDIS